MDGVLSAFAVSFLARQRLLQSTKGRNNARSLFQVQEIQQFFIFVCKPESHEGVYQWLDFLEKNDRLTVVTQRQWNGKRGELWRYLRHALGARKTFFNDLRALTRYMIFNSCNHLFLFMEDGLEISPLPP